MLKVEVLDLALRVPYGLVSNREGKGALPGSTPTVPGCPANEPYFNQGGNISVFAAVDRANGRLRGRLPGDVPVGFDLAPFMGTMGVARDTSAVVDSVPPTDAGGYIDINDLTVGSTLYLPVQVPGAMFLSGDPHMVQGDGEVALTAMEGSLRPTFRLTLVKPGQRGAPTVAYAYLSAASGFRCSQIVDRTTGIHTLIRKADFA